jgi:hypothetical protein
MVVDRAWVAVARTGVLISGDDAHQEDTYVRPAGRGHRFGAFAKAP